MYKNIVVALDESEQAKRAQMIAIELAKQIGASIHFLTVSEPLPAYAAFMDAGLPGARQMLLEGRIAFYQDLQKEAMEQAVAVGLKPYGTVIEGDEVQRIVDHLDSSGADLLVLGPRHHGGTSNLWGGTVHSIAEKVRCSILAVF